MRSSAGSGTHGFDSSGTWGGTMRVDEPGSGNCNLMGSEMEVGDSDLGFLHLSSCNSMDRNQWPNWWRSMKRAHQIDGFHGFMWIGSGLVSNYEDFASDAFDGSISSAWLDNHYVPNISGSDDQCPLAYAVGANHAYATNRLFSPCRTRPGHQPDAAAVGRVDPAGADRGRLDGAVRARIGHQGDRLARREDVVERVVDVLIDQGTSNAAKLDARLGYVQLSDGGEGEFQPVVLVSADDTPSPFLFSVPVVTPGGGGDRRPRRAPAGRLARGRWSTGAAERTAGGGRRRETGRLPRLSSVGSSSSPVPCPPASFSLVGSSSPAPCPLASFGLIDRSAAVRDARAETTKPLEPCSGRLIGS